MRSGDTFAVEYPHGGICKTSFPASSGFIGAGEAAAQVARFDHISLCAEFSGESRHQFRDGGRAQLSPYIKDAEGAQPAFGGLSARADGGHHADIGAAGSGKAVNPARGVEGRLSAPPEKIGAMVNAHLLGCG